MTTYRTRAEGIAAALATLPSAGKVHARTRLSTDWGRYLEHFAADGQIAGWTVSRKSAATGQGGAHWVETWSLIRVCGVHDQSESEIGFQASLDDAAVLFRDQPSWPWGTVTGELALTVIEDRLMSDTVLCHVAECELSVAIYYDQLEGGEA